MRKKERMPRHHTTLAPQPLSHNPPLSLSRTTVQDGIVRTALPAYTGTWHALRTMVATEGWASLYAGLAPALLGAGLSWGAYFTAYQAAKARLSEGGFGGLPARGGGGGGPAPPSTALHLLAAAQAGAFVCVLTNPVWVVKTRLQLQRVGGVGARRVVTGRGGGGAAAAAASTASSRLGPAAASAFGAAGNAAAAGAAGAAGCAAAQQRYVGVAGTVAAILREEGVRGLYRGLAPSLLLVSHGAIQFAAYEEMRALAVAWSAKVAGGRPPGSTPAPSSSSTSSGLGGRHATPLPTATLSALGAASKVIACVATYPTQVIRSRMQQRQVTGAAGRAAGAAIRYDSAWAAARTVLAREGLGGLYKGLVPTLMRVVPQSAVTFVVYERVLAMLAGQREGVETG